MPAGTGSVYDDFGFTRDGLKEATTVRRRQNEGAFLGLDNIGIFDRSAPLPTGGHLEQADGTAWMALFSQNMLDLAAVLAAHDPNYEDMVVKFAALQPYRPPL